MEKRYVEILFFFNSEWCDPSHMCYSLWIQFSFFSLTSTRWAVCIFPTFFLQLHLGSAQIEKCPNGDTKKKCFESDFDACPLYCMCIGVGIRCRAWNPIIIAKVKKWIFRLSLGSAQIEKCPNGDTKKKSVLNRISMHGLSIVCA